MGSGMPGMPGRSTAVRVALLSLLVIAVIWMTILVARPGEEEDAPLEFSVHEEVEVEVTAPVPSPRATVSARLVQQQRPSPQPSIVVRTAASPPAASPHAEPSPQHQEQQERHDSGPSPSPAPRFDLGQSQATFRAHIDSLRSSAVTGHWRRTDGETRHYELSTPDTEGMEVFGSSEGFKALAQEVGVQCLNLRDVLALDADQDGEYDILSVNHNAEQTLLMHTEEGFRASSRPDLEIDPALPGLAMHPDQPELGKSGLYIYWFGGRLLFHLYVVPGRIGRESTLPDPLELSITVPLGPVSAFAQDGSTLNDVSVRNIEVGEVTVSEVSMKLHHGSQFSLTWRRKAVEVDIFVDANSLLLPLEDIHVGHGGASPSRYDFSVALRDRHSYVSLDANGDGWQDLLILRGGLQGDIASLEYSDELLVFDSGSGLYEDNIQQTGFEMRAARSNQAAVGDFNGDGVLELLISSRDCRSSPEPPRVVQIGIPGDYSTAFVDVSDQFFPSFFGVSTLSFTEFVVADMDRDGMDDIVSIGPFGVHFHTYRGEAMVTESCSDLAVFGSADMCNVVLSQAVDVNGDGFPEILLAGAASMVLTYSPSAGGIVAFPTIDLGLPDDIHLSRWVDYDNDGCIDLFTVPGGLYQSYSCESEDGKGFFGAFFMRTGLLEVTIPLPRADKESSWVQWTDVDGDGSLDLAPYVLKSRVAAPTCDTSVVALNYHSSGNWLHVDVEGPTGAPFCHAAEVTVRDSSGRIQTARVGSAEHSRYSQTHSRLYFGLGRFEVAELLVHFSGDTVVSAASVCTNCRIAVAHPAQES